MIKAKVLVLFILSFFSFGSYALEKVNCSEDTTIKQCIGNLRQTLNQVIDAQERENPWLECGSIMDIIQKDGELSKYPKTSFEYAIRWNSEIHQIKILSWNHGLKIINKEPYLVNSDNMTNGAASSGGVVMYRGTLSSDECPSDFWRAGYWRFKADHSIEIFYQWPTCQGSNMKILCRKL